MNEQLTGPVTFDVVELKSGGPAMTVIEVKEDGLHCIWYGESADEVRTEIIPAICVEKATLWEDENEEDSEGGKKKRHDDD